MFRAFSRWIATFLSTLPARGATRRQGVRRRLGSYFYPRSPRGERLTEVCEHWVIEVISIHAPREGSDGMVGGFSPYAV